MKNDVIRVLRGGSYYFDTRLLRTTRRYGSVPEGRSKWDGFRIVVVQRRSP